MKYKEDEERMNLTVNYKKLMRDWVTYGSLSMSQIMKEVETNFSPQLPFPILLI